MLCSGFASNVAEFDEGKRSCRRRLAGHNRRRRKTHPENVVNGASLNDEKGSSYLLISLLRILSNLHSNSSDQEKNQDLLSHLLRNLASLAGATSEGSISKVLQESQALENAGKTAGTLGKGSDKITTGFESAGPSTMACKSSEDIVRPLGQGGAVPVSDLAQKSVWDGTPQPMPSSTSTKFFPSRCDFPAKIKEPKAAVGRIKFNNIDLNNVYDGSQDSAGNLELSPAPLIPGTGSINCPLWLQSGFHKRSLPQMSGNSDSTSSQSPSSSSGEAQSCTDRIVFKLFGKDPNDFPITLRTQILDWLSHSPTDIESYIRPGCIILTIYLRLGKPEWEEICIDLGARLSKLLDGSTDSFWRTGWVYARVQHCVSFIYNGQVVLDTPLPLKSHKHCRISSIKPIAVTLSERTDFTVKGFNIFRPSTRLLCALEGKYLVQETSRDLMDGADTTNEHNKLQCLTFPCSIPNIIGRGFVEVEDHGLSSSFFPFIVAEKEVCSEICLLEEALEVPETADGMHKNTERIEAKNQALDFVNEMGWLLHRSRLKFRLGDLYPNLDLFPFRRYKWLIEFSMDHDWCAVVKKLLAILFDGTVDTGEHSSIELALLDMGLLHRAVQRNCRSMVELLLRYVPDKEFGRSGLEQRQEVDGGYKSFIFKPDDVGPGGLTPLHVAAIRDGSENILDALTDDPGFVGIEAWRRARDSTGLTPNDYACLRGHYSYIHLIQRKINTKSENGHVVLDIPRTLVDCNTKQKDGLKSSKFYGLQIGRMEMNTTKRHCRLCEQKLARGQSRTSLVYRPAMLSMVAIAAVCVCVALLFKSSPEVLYVFQPFRWELVKYGSS
ncbi:squamosa promoter-binding-like protein 1 isoform X2 [Ricinus communis]|uniref:squamosa promoter-binding-like protein 1 isoform X2 n=1 Tax=Ricinus communis TaxID=3988 RepID=UPI000772D012|nr:squamosa promoter-binding-like protein 1 isoform X2 [Ricinus communis]|eukprot:XP_015574731.1 squamosa promoter-binding-like protein 1 isoform X2 [Ricinus communis]